jgi:glycosyltransferase involved in cell wall biosynthesis
MQLALPPVRLKPDLTAAVVICTRNRPAQLRKCLEAVAYLARTPDELIVVDNTSGDKETEYVALEFSAHYILEPIQGLSRARNRALLESKSEIVAYLDDDSVPDEHWLELLLEPFADPRVASVTGGTIMPGSPVDDANRERTWLLSNNDRQWFEIAAFGGLGIGTNMALRRVACMGWSVFDERLGRGALFEGMEEHHAFLRLVSLSYYAAHVPAAIVFHRSQKSGEIKREARNQIGYAMLLFAEYPMHRLELLGFLFRRLRRRPLKWLRDSPDPGEIITSGWRVLLNATFSAVPLFLRNRKPKRT